MRDEKAVRLLKRAYWGSGGWRTEPLTADVRAYLLATGYLKESPRLGHDECLQWALTARAASNQGRVAAGFLYSLSSRQLEYRSALGSLAHIRGMPEHHFDRADVFASAFCRYCGYEAGRTEPHDFGPMNFERHQWGGVRHDKLEYMAADLEWFAQLPDPNPTASDRHGLHSILDAAADAPNLGVLKTAIGKIIPSNDAERTQLCEILAYAGILQPTGLPSFAEAYVPWDERHDGAPRSDLGYPLSCWRGRQVCRDALHIWFDGLL